MEKFSFLTFSLTFFTLPAIIVFRMSEKSKKESNQQMLRPRGSIHNPSKGFYTLANAKVFPNSTLHLRAKSLLLMLCPPVFIHHKMQYVELLLYLKTKLLRFSNRVDVLAFGKIWVHRAYFSL